LANKISVVVAVLIFKEQRTLLFMRLGSAVCLAIL